MKTGGEGSGGDDRPHRSLQTAPTAEESFARPPRPIVPTGGEGSGGDGRPRRSTQTAPAAEESFARPPRPIVPTGGEGSGGDDRPHRSMSIGPGRFDPQTNPAVAGRDPTPDAPPAAVEARLPTAAPAKRWKAPTP